MDPKKLGGKERMAKSPNRLSASEAVLRMAQKRLDKAASKGVIHKNAAARRTSRLMKSYAAAAATES